MATLQMKTPNNGISTAQHLPTIPPAPRQSNFIDQSLVQKSDSCPRVPDLPSSADANFTPRLMPRPRLVEMPYWRRSIDYDTAETAYAAYSKAGMAIPESLMEAFANQNINREDEDGRKVKRVRRTSLLDGLPPRRASFAGAA